MNHIAAPLKPRSSRISPALGPTDPPALLRALEGFATHEARITERFYEIFFERRPDTLELFGAHSIAEREEMMHETLHSLYALYERQLWLEDNLVALGKSHWEYGVTEDMYTSFIDPAGAHGSDLNGLTESLRRLRSRGIEVFIECHGDVTQENSSERANGDIPFL